MIDLFRHARLVLPYTRRFRGRVVGALLLVLALSLAEVLKPWPLKIVVDNALGGAPLSAIGYPRAIGRDGLLALAALGLVALYALIGGLSIASNYLTIDVGQRMVDDFRADLHQQLQRLSLAFHGRQSVGDLIFRLTADTFAIQTLAMNGLFPTVSAVVMLGGMLAVMAHLNATLTLIALGVCPVLGLSIRWLGERISRDATSARERESELYTAAQRSMSAIKVIQAFTSEEEELASFRRASQASLRANLRLYTVQTSYAMVLNVIGAAGTAAVVWVGARGVLGGTLTIGDLLVFTSYLASLYAPIHTLANTFGLVQAAKVGVGRVFEILQTAPDLPDGPRSIVAGGVRGRIELCGVDFGYEPSRLVLRDVCLDAAPGETVAIVGETGAGKSTLVSLVARFYDPVAGEVRLDGEDLRAFDKRSLRQQIAMVLQPPLVFPATLRDNIAYGRRGATAREVEAAAQAAQLEPLLAKLPAGLDTVLGEAISLSEGERQRVTIARALLRAAPILILDEPTSALDAETEMRLMAALEPLLRGRTAFVIAHRLSTVRRADRIVVLREGRIVEVGSFAQLMERGGHFARLHTTQFAPHRETTGVAG